MDDVSLAIRPLVDISSCFCFPAPVNSATVNIHVQVFVQLCGFCMFLRVESWGRVVPLCLKGQFESPSWQTSCMKRQGHEGSEAGEHVSRAGFEKPHTMAAGETHGAFSSHKTISCTGLSSSVLALVVCL